MLAGTADAAVPVITSPVVASVSSNKLISITFEGTDFYPGGTPSLVFTGSWSATISKTDSRVRDWTCTMIQVDSLPVEAMSASLKVSTSGGNSSTKTVAYTYEWYELAGNSYASPLAVAVSDEGVWMSLEFADKQRMLPFDQLTGTAPAWPASSMPDIFRKGDGNPTKVSHGNEDVKIDAHGAAWFPQAGAILDAVLHTPAKLRNHTRLVRYASMTAEPEMFAIPGDNQGSLGVAMDSTRDRVWLATQQRGIGVYPGPGDFPAKLMSFHPFDEEANGIPAVAQNYDFPTTGLSCGMDNYCSNADYKQCWTNADCVLADQICEAGTACDTEDGDADRDTFHEYELPSNTYIVGRLLVDDDPRMVWYNVYFARFEGPRIGRLDPTIPSDPDADPQTNPIEYPLKPIPALPPGGCGAPCSDLSDIRCMAYCAGSQPWDIAKAPDGNIVFTESGSNRLGRFRVEELDDPMVDCTAVVSGVNPCIDEVDIPAADPLVHMVHSLAYDHDDDLWFTMFNRSTSTKATIGYLQDDWSTFVMLPTLSYFRCPDQWAGSHCATRYAEDGVSANGITMDPTTKDMWFAEFRRKRFGRIRDAASKTSYTWAVASGSNDAWEDSSATSPTKPKFTATTLKLDTPTAGGIVRSIAGFRITSPGTTSGRPLSSELRIPITSPGTTRTVRLRVYAGPPNDSAWNDVTSELTNRRNAAIASIDVVRTLTSSTSELSLDISKLLDVAQRHANWNAGSSNVIPIYMERHDQDGFSLTLRSSEYTPSITTKIVEVRNNH